MACLSGGSDPADGRARRSGRDDPDDACRVTADQRRSAAHCSVQLALGRPTGVERLSDASSCMQGLVWRKGWRRGKLGTVTFAADIVPLMLRPAKPATHGSLGFSQLPTRKGRISCLGIIDAYSRFVAGHPPAIVCGSSSPTMRSAWMFGSVDPHPGSIL